MQLKEKIRVYMVKKNFVQFPEKLFLKTAIGSEKYLI